MKHLKLFFALFAMLALGVGNAWAETITFSTNSTTVGKGTPMTGKFDYKLTFTNTTDAGNAYVQNAKNSSIFNTVAIPGTITSIQLTDCATTSTKTDGSFKVYGGTSSDDGCTNEMASITGLSSTKTNKTINFSGDYSYFKIVVGSDRVLKISSIIITYTPSGGGETPDPTPDPEDPETPGTGGEANTVTFTYEDLKGQGASSTGAEFTGATKDSIFMSGKGYCKSTNSYVQIYANNYLTFTPTNATITRIVLTATSGYIKTWKASEGTIEVSGDKATWTGSSTSVVTLTNTATAQARITQMDVTYTISGGGTEEPVLSVSPGNITWKGIAASAEKSEEITVTLSNIEAVMAELSGDNPTAFSIDKDLLEASGKIIVSKNTTTIGDYAAILTITDTDTQTKTIALSMEVVADPEPTGTFEKFTGTIEEGDYVLVANETTDALKNTINQSNRFDCGTVQVVDDKIVNPDKSVIWHIAANGTYWTMYNESTTKYAGGTTTKNQGALLDDVTDLAKWTITVDGEGVYTFENYGRSQQASDPGNKFLSKNSQGAYWATYASGQKNPVLYKKSDGKQPAGLVYETNKYRTKLGDSFATPTLTNPNTLNVTYSSSNNDVAEVANDGAITIKAVGGVEITATFAGSETHRQGSAKYTICVTEHAGTETDPYTVADAKRVIDVLGTVSDVYATGIVSQVDTYNSTYKSITYWISADGTSTNHMQVYGGLNKEGEEPFSSKDDIKTGDEVVVKGNLKLHNGTLYEFDANNQLVSLKREKQQAGLAYATTEYSTTLGESFETPTLTNPNGLTVTYSSDNTSAVEVNEETGEVTIKAVGKAKITATFAGNSTYAPGSASYTITVTGVATLPFAFDGKQADIENTPGMSHKGIEAEDYNNSPYLKMNTTGDWLIVHFDGQPDKLTYDIKNNSFSGGTFSVLESADGETYTDVAVHTTIEGTQNEEYTLLSTSRYVKFIYTEKLNGNVGLGNIKITKPDLRQEAGIAWSAESTTITIGDAFTAPTLSYPKGLTLSCTSDNEDLATVTNAGVVTLKEGVTGKAVITATFAGNETYKPAEVTTTIIVNPKTGDVVILAKHQGKWYAMKAEYPTIEGSEKTDRLAAVPVYYVNGKLYNVSEEDKAAITWTRSAYGDNTVSFQNNGKYLKGKYSSTTLILEEDEDELYQWNAADNTMLIGETTRTFLYHKDGFFRNYSITLASEASPTYSDFPVVTAPEFATGNVYSINASATNGTAKGAGMYVEGSTVTLMADPKMDHTFVNWTVGGAEVSTANPYVFTASKDLELVANFAKISQTSKTLSGTFSVGEHEVAQFATGNLQYNVKDKKWSFAKQQYQYIGDANINVGDHDFTGTIDLFGWSNGENNNFGANQSGNKNDYIGEFVDWGKLFPTEDNWSTLSHEQWDYLLNKRGAGKKQIARVGTVFGVMLFPDVWNAPLTIEAQYDNYFKINVYNYTLDQWTKLETAGAVFFPAAGRRFGGYGNTINYDGTTDLGEEYKLQYCTNDLAAYWTSTKHNDGEKVSYLLNLGNKGAKYSTLELGWYEYGHVGQSVRLAKVTDVYTRTVTNGEWGTICLPYASSSFTGAAFYEVSSLVVGEGLWLDQLADGDQLVAGKPYIFQATATKITVTYTGEEVSAPVEGANGLTGTFTEIAAGGLTGNYIIAENKVWVAGTGAKLPANRAYIANTVPTTPQAQIPGRRRVCMGENQTTGLDNITNGENTTIKTIENGQLIIIRNGEKFNAQGQRL